MTRRTMLAVALSAVLGLVLAAAGCGVPIDEEPRPVTRTTAAPTEGSPTTIASDGTQEVAVYFLRDDTLERQGYPVDGEPTLRQALGFVLEAPPEGSAPGLRTSVPPGTALRGVEVADGVATIDLTNEINDVSGVTQKEAFAQIVFTTLAFEAVQEVRFLVEGRPIDAPTDDGNLALVSADNYNKPLNPR